MNIYVGNLAPETTEDGLRQAFGAFGQGVSFKLLKDRITGKSNRIGFVGMADSDEARTAISTLNGKGLDGDVIKAEEGKRKIDHRDDRDKQDGFGGDRGDRDRHDRFDRSGRGGRRY